MNQEREAAARLEQYVSWLENIAPVSPYLNIGGQGKIADIRLLLALRSGGEGWRPIEEAEDRFVLAAIDHGGTMVTVRAERIGVGYHDTRMGSSVGWRPGRNQRGFFKPWPMFEAAPSPSTHGEG